MTTTEQIYNFLCSLAPLDLKMEFDNVGLLVGRKGAEVKRVLLALDITDAVIDEAVDCGAHLIVSHHPVIFHKLRGVTDLGPDDKVLRLAENRIGAICMHTNLDIAPGGVNDVLLALLGATGTSALDENGCGRIGELPEEMPLSAFLSRCKEVLHVPALRYVDGGKAVRRLAVMGGAGGDALPDAWESGCDTYVTADVKYHQFLAAKEMGVNLIDADHFCTENPVIPVLTEKLRAVFPDVMFTISARHSAVISFF